MTNSLTHRRDGVAAAAMLSAGIGCATIGVCTILSEAFPAVKAFLTWWVPAGPLTGKTGMGVIIWLGSWFFLHTLWAWSEFSFIRIWRWTIFLIVIGWIGTFPLVFELFATSH